MLTEDEYMNALRGAEDPKTFLTFKIIDDNVIMRDEIIGEATVAFKDLLQFDSERGIKTINLMRVIKDETKLVGKVKIWYQI